MHRAVASSSGGPTDLRLRDSHSGSHPPQKLRSRCGRDTTLCRAERDRTVTYVEETLRDISGVGSLLTSSGGLVRVALSIAIVVGLWAIHDPIGYVFAVILVAVVWLWDRDWQA